MTQPEGQLVDAAILVRFFERLRTGTKVSEILRELVRLGAGLLDGGRSFCGLKEGGEPLLLASWPGPGLTTPLALFDGPMGLEVLAAGAPLFATEPAGGLSHGLRFTFHLSSGLEGALVVLGPAPIAEEPFRVLGETTAALLHSWDSERRLKDLGERHRLVSQATQHIIYEWDIPNDTLRWNARMTDVLGHQPTPEREHIGWWREQVHADDRERAWTSLQRALRESELYWTCEYRFRRADGSYAWVFDRAALAYDIDARPVRMLGVMEDISRDRELESRLALASRLAAVGSLASGIAHEINNPLAWVTSNLSFALEEVKRLARGAADVERCEELGEALDDAQTGAGRIAQIVSDLRTFAHADHERLSPVSVKRVVEGALTMANNELKHRARLVRRLEAVPMVLANEARLGQAVVNLLLNAAWSAGTPGTTAEIVVVTRTDGAGRAVVEVVDNGPPLSDDVLPHVFDPFYSARPSGEGIGLGLAVTQSIIRGFGGIVEVESGAGKGTAFRVVLPQVPEDELPLPAPSPPTTEPRAHIIVIDDEPAILTAIERMLAPFHEVVGFRHGLQALDAIRARPPDVILCDVMMPEMSAAEVWDRLADTQPEILARVVLLTGGAFTREAQAFVDRSQAPVVDKPFSARTLRDVVRQLLKKAE
jgi:PAS domain S-box-containing protein